MVDILSSHIIFFRLLSNRNRTKNRLEIHVQHFCVINFGRHMHFSEIDLKKSVRFFHLTLITDCRTKTLTFENAQKKTDTLANFQLFWGCETIIYFCCCCCCKRAHTVVTLNANICRRATNNDRFISICY